jgi:hypothetical protein
MQDRETPLRRVAFRVSRRVATCCNSTIDPTSSTDASCQRTGFAVLSKLPIERLTRGPHMGRASSPPGRQIPLNSLILYPAARGKGSHRKGNTCENHRPPHIDSEPTDGVRQRLLRRARQRNFPEILKYGAPEAVPVCPGKRGLLHEQDGSLMKLSCDLPWMNAADQRALSQVML